MTKSPFGSSNLIVLRLERSSGWIQGLGFLVLDWVGAEGFRGLDDSSLMVVIGVGLS